MHKNKRLFFPQVEVLEIKRGGTFLKVLDNKSRVFLWVLIVIRTNCATVLCGTLCLIMTLCPHKV